MCCNSHFEILNVSVFAHKMEQRHNVPARSQVTNLPYTYASISRTIQVLNTNKTSDNMANTAPGRLQWTKSEFEKHADCEIADDFWKLVEDQLQVKPEDDSFFTLVVTQAKKAATDKKLRAENEKLLAEKEKLLAEKEKQEKLHHSEIKKIQAERDDAIQAAQKKSYLVLSVSAAAKDGSSR